MNISLDYPKTFSFLTLLRDSLLASLLDGVRASGNRDVCVKMTSTHKGQRWGLLSMPVDEEVESLHLRFLATPPSKYWFNYNFISIHLLNNK